MKREALDRFVWGLVVGIFLVLGIVAGAIFIYTRMVNTLPGDAESSVNYMIYAPPISYEQAQKTVEQAYDDVVIKKISLEGEHGFLFREVVLMDDTFVAVDANVGTILFTGRDLDDDDEEEDSLWEDVLEDVQQSFQDDEEVEEEKGRNDSIRGSAAANLVTNIQAGEATRAVDKLIKEIQLTEQEALEEAKERREDEEKKQDTIQKQREEDAEKRMKDEQDNVEDEQKEQEKVEEQREKDEERMADEQDELEDEQEDQEKALDKREEDEQDELEEEDEEEDDNDDER